VSCAALLAAEGTARAGNQDSFFYSDDAAMTAGAVTATTRDAGAIWYNPAGLGGISRGQVDLSGTTFAVRFRPVSGALATTYSGGHQSTDLNASDFFSAPHALTIIRAIGPTVAVGFGLYVTLRDVRTAESELEFDGNSGGAAPVPIHFQQRMDLTIDQTRYHAGPGIGWQIAPSFRIGASLFGTYGKTNGFAQYAIHGNDPSTTPSTTDAFILAETRAAFTYIGAQAQVGAQWDPTPDWHIGLLVRSPELLFSASARGANVLTFASIAPGEAAQASFVLQHPEAAFPAFTVVAPMRVVAGIARAAGDRTWISAEADYAPPVSNQGIELQPTVNARLGARVRASDKLSVGAGVFTDRATERNVGTSLGEERVDYYGGTAGLEYRTPLSLSTNTSPDALVLSTTVALRYAIGLGDARAANIDLTSTNTPDRTVSVVYHEIVPYIGSGILF